MAKGISEASRGYVSTQMNSQWMGQDRRRLASETPISDTCRLLLPKRRRTLFVLCIQAFV